MDDKPQRRRAPGPFERVLALCAAYVAGTWLIALLVGAPLDEALTLPFLVFVPIGLIAVCLGAVLILILRRTGRNGPAAHVIGAACVPFLTIVVLRLVLGGLEGLQGLFGSLEVLPVMTAGGVLSGLVLSGFSTWAGDL